MTSSLTVGYQNDILLNFLLTSIEILIRDNLVYLPHCLPMCICHNKVGLQIKENHRLGISWKLKEKLPFTKLSISLLIAPTLSYPLPLHVLSVNMLPQFETILV